MRSFRYYRYNQRNYTPTIQNTLASMLGDALNKIIKIFLKMQPSELDELFTQYNLMYGSSAEKYARETYPKWKSGMTKLSGKTMERLIELVPPFLSSQLRYELLKDIFQKHKKNKNERVIRVNVKEPIEDLREAEEFIINSGLSEDEKLPDSIVEFARWIYDDDMVVAKEIIKNLQLIEGERLKETALKEFYLLKRTIISGQVRTAELAVELPLTKLRIIAYSPSKCFIATVCFGESAYQTNFLRIWRDNSLIKTNFGRKFIILYYKFAGEISKKIAKHKLLIGIFKQAINFIIFLIKLEKRIRNERSK